MVGQLVLLELVAGAGDRVVVEVGGVVEQVPLLGVLLMDLSIQGQARQCTQDSAPGSVLASLLQGWQLERKTSEGVLVLWMTL